MITIDPWTNILEQFYPSYSDLKEIMDRGPKYILKLTRVKKSWRIQIKEEWPDGINYGTSGSVLTNDGNDNLVWTPTGVDLDDRCNWAETQLAEWDNCRRTSWDMWQFKYKRDAEKFITLYHMVWAV